MQNEGLLNLNDSSNNSFNDHIDDGLGDSIPARSRCCWGRFYTPRTKHILLGLLGVSLLLTTVTLIQLSTISYALLQVQQKLPGVISGYTDEIIDKAETMIETQIDGVVEKVGDDVKDTMLNDLTEILIPDLMGRIKNMLYDEFGGQVQFRLMVDRLEKLSAYACQRYPAVCG